jgi:hypothetical protein
MTNPLARILSIIFGVTALLILFVEVRLNQQGRWIPKDLPLKVGGWDAADMPLSGYALQQLGNPPAIGRRYTNLFNERIDAHVIATATFDAYLEPTIVWAGYGYQLTGERVAAPFGKAGQVRQMLLQSVRDGSRILMYYWIQGEDGTTAARGSLRDYRDVLPRLGLGMNALFGNSQKCIVRVYTQLHPMDPKGLQARRSMDEISAALYKSLKAQGSAGEREVVGKIDESGKKVAGADASYLTTPLVSDDPDSKRKNLIPLTPGNVWEMTARCAGETERERVVVGGLVNVEGVTGTQIDVFRKGKRWRREILRKVGDEIQIVALQDETSPLMVMNPPLPLLREPTKEGNTTEWVGDYKLIPGPRPDGVDSGLKKTEIWPSRAYSRISGLEPVTTPAGKFKAFRVDTVVVANRVVGGRAQEVRFPMVRWLAPGVGYVRRGFADKGRPAFAELTRFDVK